MKKILFILSVVLMFSLCACSDESEIDSKSYAQGYIDAIDEIDVDLLIERGIDASELELSDNELDLVYTIVTDGLESCQEEAYYEYRNDLRTD